MQNVVIYGERCSGTNYLEQLIKLNFETQVTWKFGWKHFMGFNKLEETDNTLFICIVRNPVSWINSCYKKKHHYGPAEKGFQEFISNEFWSRGVDGKEIMEDRHIYTGERYRNIFELRYTKLKYMIDDLPKRVKHCLLIKYEDLLDDFEGTMNKLKNRGMVTRPCFPKNISQYYASGMAYKGVIYKREAICDEIYEAVVTHPYMNLEYEQSLGYFVNE